MIERVVVTKPEQLSGRSAGSPGSARSSVSFYVLAGVEEEEEDEGRRRMKREDGGERAKKDGKRGPKAAG